MDKLLYFGHLSEGFSGWSRASYEYIRALSTQFDVVARSVPLTKNISPPEDIQECINKELGTPKYCIQHVLPHYLEYSGYFKKNVCIAILESNNLIENDWTRRINLMDEVWSPSEYKEESITKPIKIFPHAGNIHNYNISEGIEVPAGYNFYTICDFTRRKNINALIRAFHAEFSVNEPVNLVLKMNKFNTSTEELEYIADESFKKIKEGLKLYSRNGYKREYLITNDLNEFEINGLHKSCDCYVSTSYGEAWGWPIFDSMAFGNCIVAPNKGGHMEYLQHYTNKYLVETRTEPCYAALETFDHLYSAYETWENIDILDLQKQMRRAYNDRSRYIKSGIVEEGLEVIKKYNYEKVGQLAKELL